MTKTIREILNCGGKVTLADKYRTPITLQTSRVSLWSVIDLNEIYQQEGAAVHVARNGYDHTRVFVTFTK